MGSPLEREVRELMGNPGPRSFAHNEALGRAMTADEVEVVMNGGTVIPDRQEDGTVMAVVTAPEEQ